MGGREFSTDTGGCDRDAVIGSAARGMSIEERIEERSGLGGAGGGRQGGDETAPDLACAPGQGGRRAGGGDFVTSAADFESNGENMRLLLGASHAAHRKQFSLCSVQNGQVQLSPSQPKVAIACVCHAISIT